MYFYDMQLQTSSEGFQNGQNLKEEFWHPQKLS